MIVTFGVLCIHTSVAGQLELQFEEHRFTRQLLGVDAWATAKPCMAAPSDSTGKSDSMGKLFEAV